MQSLTTIGVEMKNNNNVYSACRAFLGLKTTISGNAQHDGSLLGELKHWFYWC